MDCCNYVQPYPSHGHFYQQQHHFCYDNMNAYGAGAYGGGSGGGAPVSDSIEANAARYNRLPPAYPTGTCHRSLRRVVHFTPHRSFPVCTHICTFKQNSLLSMKLFCLRNYYYYQLTANKFLIFISANQPRIEFII